MHVPRLALLSAAALLVVQAAAAGQAPEPVLVADPLRIEQGLISGIRLAGDVRVYKGLPYAAPPVGPLRWKPPEPPASWEGVRECTAFSAICPQPRKAMLGPSRVEKGAHSEDCLYLNVWTPGRTSGDGLPVMVWIHGGGFTIGAGSSDVFDGAALARKGVVVVTLNYRLGPFGFLAHPLLSRESPRGVSGNYGLLDMVAALRWVRRNISAFGGDPGCVTVFGESAGAAAVSRLMVSPLAGGLFHRAIAQSGGPFGLFNRHLTKAWYGTTGMESVGERMARALGCDGADDPLAAMRAASQEEVLGALDLAVGLFSQGERFGPVTDGWVLPDDPAVLWTSGKMHDVPFLAGSNADEALVFQHALPVRRLAGYRLLLRMRFGRRAPEVERLFPARTEEEIRQAINKVTTVTGFSAAARAMARCMEQVSSPGYLYHFTRVPDTPLRSLGAFHGLEIVYVFGNVRPVRGFDGTDVALSDAMSDCWVQFARTGDPSVEGRPSWPAYERESDVHMEFGDTMKAGTGLYREACDLSDEIQAERVRSRARPGRGRGR